MKSEKVFCGHCKYYRFDSLGRDTCRHPENFEDTPIWPGRKFVLYAEDINVNNDCDWYAAKRARR